MPTLPSFERLSTHFKRVATDAAMVKKTIGGNVDLPWIQNLCVVRLSYAFNYCGEPIRSGDGLSTIRGGDDRRYAYRVREFKGYLERRYKPADVIGTSMTEFAHQSGIIIFDANFSDATGHADLWDGGTCLYRCYWNQANQIHLWLC
jgi:hypothetical protein